MRWNASAANPERDTRNRRNKNRDNALPTYIPYHVAERGEDKSFWTRIGAAWEHGDREGFTLQLDLMPVDGGKIVLRTRKDDEEKGA